MNVKIAETATRIGKSIRQTCFDLSEVTSDEEVQIIANDNNDDGKINSKDLDFQLSKDGAFYEADFIIWQQEWFWDQNQKGCEPGVNCTGPTLWGFMDTPSTFSFQYSTCNQEGGLRENTYNADFQGGKTFLDVLNTPTNYLVADDWVASEGYIWEDIFDRPIIDIDWEIQ